MNTLTLDNYFQETGKRFRVSKEQFARMQQGSLTREQAFDEFVRNGGPKPTKEHVSIPTSVLTDVDLNPDNFDDKMKAATGKTARFRMNREQMTRFKAGQLTRDAAFAEFLRNQNEQA